MHYHENLTPKITHYLSLLNILELNWKGLFVFQKVPGNFPALNLTPCFTSGAVILFFLNTKDITLTGREKIQAELEGMEIA